MKRLDGVALAASNAALKREHTAAVQTLYRRLMKKRWDHCVMSRSHWHEWCWWVRSRIEERRGETDPSRIREYMQEGEDYLKRLTDPKPYRLPWTKGGTMWGRNIPVHPVVLDTPIDTFEGHPKTELVQETPNKIWRTSEAEYVEMEYGRPEGLYQRMRVETEDDIPSSDPMYTETPEMEAKDWPCWRDFSLQDKQAELQGVSGNTGPRHDAKLHRLPTQLYEWQVFY
eukprot:g82809.t1